MKKNINILFFVLPIIFLIYGIADLIILGDISSYYTTIVGVSLIAAIIQLAFFKRKKYMPIIICAIIKYLYSFGFTLLIFLTDLLSLWDCSVINHLLYYAVVDGILFFVLIYLAVTEFKKIKKLRSL